MRKFISSASIAFFLLMLNVYTNAQAPAIVKQGPDGIFIFTGLTFHQEKISIHIKLNVRKIIPSGHQ